MAMHMVNAVVSDATGLSDGDRCVGEPPSAKYYLAALAPSDQDMRVSAVRKGRETANGLGFEFETSANPGTVYVDAEASVYYRVFPTYEEQLEAASIHQTDGTTTLSESSRLVPVYRRVGVRVTDIPLEIGINKPTVNVGHMEFATQFREVEAGLQSDPSIYRRPADDGRRDISVPRFALENARAFEQWIAKLPGQPVMPKWDAGIVAHQRRVYANGNRTRVEILLTNYSQEPKQDVTTRQGEQIEVPDRDRDHGLFRAHIAVRASAPETLLPIEIHLGPDAYRYDPQLAGYAINCGIEPVWDGNDLTAIRSVAAPVETTYRTQRQSHSSTNFEVLEHDPLPELVRLAEELEAYPKDAAWSLASLNPEQARVKEHDREAVAAEARRFRAGLTWLRRDERLLLAFRLANRAMITLGNLTGKNYTEWRLFQLVFIVSQLPALTWREWPEDQFEEGLWGDDGAKDPTSSVSVLWYPTGGGKTEAYLGLAMCAMFYDRARGKTRGVTAWCRFPLRLLSLQQTQRLLAVVAAADEVRDKAAPELREVGGSAGDPFALGFYVGESNSPNSLSRDSELLARLHDETRRSRLRVVDECPYCGKRAVSVPMPDPTDLRLRHVCKSCQRDLPLYVVDNEIFRYLPSLVVGTVDKLAGIGLSDKFGALLGDVDCECDLHGLGRGGKCHERRMQGHPKNVVHPLPMPLYDPSPSLEIVDELHMLREELGAFDGHYETALATIQRQLTGRQRQDGRAVRMKVIATTATIKGEDRQCEHLFGLRSVVFPLAGPSLEESFYWKQSYDEARRFVGILPNRLTAEMTLIRVLIALHKAIQNVQIGSSLPPIFDELTEQQINHILDLYRVSLTYVTSLVDFGKLRRSVDTQINPGLANDGFREINVEELSSDTAAQGVDRIRNILDDLQMHGGTTDAVIATSMASHGVDIGRLNLMVFNGMPKSMAEYIQASSRVGREYPGAVFMVYNPVRERDRSHYRYHGKFHQYLDRMVEPVAINRWSKFAATKTFPGILMAEILQTLNRQWWEMGGAPQHLHELARMQAAIRAVSAGGLPLAQQEALLRTLSEAYLSDRPEATELRAELSESLERVLGSLRSAGVSPGRGSGLRQYRGTADYLGLEYDPMTSLRDVEEAIPFFVSLRKETR